MRRTAFTAAVPLTLAASFAWAPGVVGQQSDTEAPGPALRSAAVVTLEAYSLDEGVEVDLDGRLDEEVWQLATPIRDFTQQLPVEGGTPSEETEIRVVYDRDHLYIGAIIYDDPAGVLAFQRERDAGLNTDDRFMWILDTFRDGRTGYFFEINAAGLMGDGILTGGGGGGGGFGGPGGGGGGGGFGGGTNKAWDGIWEARTVMRPDGWSAEIRIPFRTLNFDPDLSEWGINFQRTIRRKNEEILWRGHRRSEGLRSPVYAGQLTGLRGMSQGLGLEARPSMIGGWQNSLVDSDPIVEPRLRKSAWPGDVSLDVNYSVTSSLRASVSVNTDFAEVESDQRRVNLTRFPLRFPERRDFFLEGSGVFSFAPSNGPSPFYSRHIGLTDGQPVPITYGTRMTGQVGLFEIGFYQIGTSEHDYLDSDNLAALVPRESFTVGRIKRRLFEQSSVGAIYTRRGTSPDNAGFAPEVGHTAGVDFEFNTRNFLGDKNLGFDLFTVWNSNPDAVANPDLGFGDLTARGVRVEYPNDIWTGHVSYREFGSAYDPTLGFVTRNNFRRLEPRVGWSPRPALSWIRNLDFSAQFRNQWQLGSGVLEEQELSLKVIGVSFESGDGIDLDFTRTREFLESDFEISQDVVIPGGLDYSWWEYRLNGRTAGRRKVSLFGGVTVGGFWAGDQIQYGGRVSFRPNPGVSLSTNVQINDVSLPYGDFTAGVYELEGTWTPNPWVSFTNQLQYDDQSGLVGLFARLRWIVTPGSDIYLVYTHNWQNLGEGLFDRTDLVTLSRGGSIKANYTYRF
jgi:hypothetical protein